MRKVSKGLVLAVTIALLALPLGLWTKRYELMDWWRLRDYTPSARIAQIAETTTMNSLGRRLFYVHEPELDDKSTFNSNCTIPEATIVLGCYISNYKIFLLDVKDERLQGIHEVTAAHEMLHAAYDRLSAKDRARIDALVRANFENVQSVRIKETVEGYRARDAAVVANELHSIMGTEVGTLSPELEAYYGNYFADRARIVALSEQYEQVFTGIEDKVEQYDARLQDLKTTIEDLQQSLDAQTGVISNEKARLEDLLRSNRQAYNDAVPGYNEKVRQYNSNLQALQRHIDEYNNLVNERNSVALEQRELLEAIDSRAIPTAR